MGFKVRTVSGRDVLILTAQSEWQRRGVVGRGVLLDYVSWATRNGVQYNAASKHCITYQNLIDIARDQGVQFRVGDLLMLRTGWVKWYNEATPEERIEGCKNNHNYIGVEGTADSIEWLWNQHFSALIGDNMAFEAWPAEGPYRELGSRA